MQVVQVVGIETVILNDVWQVKKIYILNTSEYKFPISLKHAHIYHSWIRARFPKYGGSILF